MGDRLQHRPVRRRAAEQRPILDPAHDLRAEAVDPRHPPGHLPAVLLRLLHRRAQPAAVAAQVVAEPGHHQRHRGRGGQFGRQLIQRHDQIRLAAIVVHVRGDRAALAVADVDRRRGQRILARPRHQRHAANVERGRARDGRRGVDRPPHHLEVELRNAVAEWRQVEVLDHHIGGPAIGGRRLDPLDRRDQRIGQLVLGPLVQPPGDPVLVEPLPVRPDPADPRHLALAQRDREADRIAVFLDGLRRPAAALAADAGLVHALEEVARPDHLPRHAVAPVDPRQGRALARTHHAEPLDAPGLDRLRPRAGQALVDHRPDRRADGLAERAARQPQHRAAEGSADRGARRGQQQGGHQRLLPGKRNTATIRRDQAGVSGDSTTPWFE